VITTHTRRLPIDLLDYYPRSSCTCPTCIAEAEIIRRFKDLHGPDFEPGAVWVRDAALKLMAGNDNAEKKETP
jgi:hypothetical protein